MSEPALRLFTVGHSNHAFARLLALLRQHGIRRLVDVRARPRSKRHPHFGRAVLETALDEAGIAYDWRGQALGGFRSPAPDSRNVALAEPGFRGFADYMGTPAFAQALDALVETARAAPTAVMCAEADVRHCHRQFIADALTLRSIDVRHIAADGHLDAHALHAALGDDRDPPVYNSAAQGDLFA